jgi:hypothetical protein
VQRGSERELLAQAGPFRRLAETLAGSSAGFRPEEEASAARA